MCWPGSREDVFELMARPEPLHHFPKKMSGFFHAAVQRIVHKYEGDASRIWSGRTSSAQVVRRFLEFDGVGPKIASMAAQILAIDFEVPFSDHDAIDISVDRHVQRVFGRLGLCRPDAGREEIALKARELHPEFPGFLDGPIWEIGRSWCKPHDPACHACPMRDLCPSAAATR